MKFGVDLKSNLTPEWRNQYIDYEGLKQIITPYEGIAAEMNIVDEQKRHSVTGARPLTGRKSTTASKRSSSSRRSSSISGIQGLGMQMMVAQMSLSGMKKQFNICSEDFFIALDKELEKINLFFAGKLSKASRSYLEIEGMTHFKYASYNMI